MKRICKNYEKKDEVDELWIVVTLLILAIIGWLLAGFFKGEYDAKDLEVSQLESRIEQLQIQHAQDLQLVKRICDYKLYWAKAYEEKVKKCQ